jgi:SAM-dependent methyltransferase
MQGREKTPGDVIRLPAEAVPLLLMQRSQYRAVLSQFVQKYLLIVFSRRLRRRVTRALLLPLEARFARAQIERRYNADMAAIYATIRDVLPQHVERVLDIGAGMGGIDCYIARSSARTAEIWLLDKSGESEEWNSGYHSDAGSFSHYNSFAQAGDMLAASGIARGRIHFVDIDRDGFPADRKFDVICSFLSWGFHYPVEVYADAVTQVLAPGGVLILDIRRGTADVAALSARFGLPARILVEGAKFMRVALGAGIVADATG